MSLRRSVIIACVLIYAAVGRARMARADTPRVVLVDVPANVARAVANALEPWHLEVVAIPGPSLGADPTAAQLRALAAGRDAQALVWFGSGEIDTALYVYDAASGAVTTRPLPRAPPLDEPAAAAVALSVKTQLLNSSLAPPEEETGDDIDPPPDGDPAAIDPRTVALELVAGGRVAASSGAAVEARADVGLTLALAPRVVAAASAQYGRGVVVDRPEIDGRLTDLTLAAEGRFHGGAAGRLSVAVALGGALHFTRLSGRLSESDAQVSRMFVDPALRAGFTWVYRLPASVALVGWTRATYMTRLQQYLVRGVPVLSTPQLSAEIGVGVAVTLR